MKNSLADGLYLDLPNDEYHSDTAIGSSTLKVLATKTPAHYKGMVRKESAAFDFGSALHMAVLEPAKAALIVCGPDDRRGKKWTDAKEAADAAGQILLTASDYSEVMAARDAVLSNKDMQWLMRGKTMAEASIFHTDATTGLRCKIRPDLVNHNLNIMADLKTCLSASPNAFSKAVLDYGYHIQNAFYERIWAGFNEWPVGSFLFVCVEKDPPYATAIYELDMPTIAEGDNLVNIGLETYMTCQLTGEWPSYPSGIQKLRLPNYGFKTLDPSEFPPCGGEAKLGGLKVQCEEE